MYTRRVSLFVLRDNKGRILLQHRSKNAPTKPDFWAFFGGGIDRNETPEDAVRREAKEELQVELGKLKLFKRYEFEQKMGLYEKYVFTAPLTYSIEELKKQQQEGQDLGLFSYEELKALKITDDDISIINDLFNNWKEHGSGLPQG